MAFNGSGTFVRLFNWVTDKNNTVPVTASRMDSEMDGMATGLSTAICKDGQTTTTARVPFTLGASSMAGSASGVSYGQINDLNTGVYFPAPDQFAVACNGTTVLTLTASTGTLLGSNILFDSGTKMLFQQTAAPTSWTKQTTHNDKALRVVSGAASSGGTSAFTTIFAARTIAQANLPNVTLSVSGTVPAPTSSGTAVRGVAATGSATALSNSTANVNVYDTSQYVQPDAVALSGGVTGSLSGGVAQQTISFDVQYVDLIIASKD